MHLNRIRRATRDRDVQCCAAQVSEYYRAFGISASQNQRVDSKGMSMPVLALGGQEEAGITVKSAIEKMAPPEKEKGLQTLAIIFLRSSSKHTLIS